ncbi:MAG: CO dehydrogenase/acetyl-CoA synthase subunit delta [Candidatus Hydrothermarchaeaceae archaeon]
MKIEDVIESLADTESVELENVTIDLDELIVDLKQAMAVPMARKARRESIKYSPPVKEYPGEIAKITLGATKADGGSRGKVVTIGGQKSLYRFEGNYNNNPVVTFDVFDISMPTFAKALREEWKDVWDSPADWAKRAVKLGADLVTIHLISTDPKIMDTSPKDAAKTVEDVLQAVKVPLVIGGSGNPEKDPKVFEKVAEAAEGEMCMIASANLDLDYKRIVKAANKYNHNVLSWTSMDINDQRTLNKLLLECGLPKERMVQDPTTGAMGYGIEYTYSLIERMKEGALKGEKVLQNPISCGVTNAWGAREAWMNEPKWGPREYRGPLWETLTALTVLMAGADIMMMLHPTAVKIVKEVIESQSGKFAGKETRFEDWLTL